MTLASQCVIIRDGDRRIAWRSPASHEERQGGITFAENQGIPAEILEKHRGLKGKELEWLLPKVATVEEVSSDDSVIGAEPTVDPPESSKKRHREKPGYRK